MVAMGCCQYLFTGDSTMERPAIILTFSLLASCTGTKVPEAPEGAVAWCGGFDYQGTWLKTESSGRAVGLSDKTIVDRLTVEDVIALTEAIGCESE